MGRPGPRFAAAGLPSLRNPRERSVHGAFGRREFHGL